MHLTRADQNDIAAAKLGLLVLQAIDEILLADRMARFERGDTVHGRDVQQDAAGKDRRLLFSATLAPDTTSEMIVSGEVVEDGAVVAEMIEGIDVSAAVGIHRDAVAGVGDQRVGILALFHAVADDLALRRVRHPYLVGLVSGAGPARHADKMIDGKIVDLGGVGPAQDRRSRVCVDQVQHANFVVFAERA